ncbi:endothelin-converting enzyme 1-like [Aphidius gifuensis]|uniref:endothelin-converting enzyme 1-like n=1 Tax=Aphidius gifuensis TaxID=684658 RepID=UPI001CDBE7A1|nr:endothelin-converting enzyme 1-like [Aphidius gifuensis]
MTELKSRRLLLMLSIGIANALWNDGPCKSDDCWKQRAREIEESLDVTIDPCDNFYAFSCGGWMKKNPAPRYYKSWTPANVYEHKMMNIFAKQRDETGFDIIESLEIIGGWPILGDKYQTPLEVIPSVILPVITKVFGVDTNSTEVKQYINNIVKVVKEISINRNIPFNTIKVLQDANDIINFQLELIEVKKKSSLGKPELFQGSDDFKNWFDLHLSGINNSHALRFCYLNPFPPFSSKENVDTEFAVENIEILENLIVLFDNTKPDTLQNFIIWDLVYKYLKFMPTRMYDIEYELNNIGKETLGLFLNREERCIRSLPFLSALVLKFLSVYYPENYKNSSKDIITKVIESSQEYVNKTSWMFSEWKNSVSLRIPDLFQYNYYLFFNNNSIDEIYGYPKIFTNNYMEDSLRISRLERHRLLQQYDRPLLDAKNLYFFDGSIVISILSHLLSKFQPNVPQASNYGPAATVVGLSIRPIFGLIDTVFYISESDNVDFMTNDMKNEFLRRYYTFKMQFHNNSTTYGLSNDTILNAIILRIIEISYLEDNFGIPAAFAAYEKNKTPEDEEISLPNYPMYKDKKLFFISYASVSV